MGRSRAWLAPFLHPLLYLLAALGLAFWKLRLNDALRPVVTNDTQGYEWLMHSTTLFEALSGLRTYGYPALLRLLGVEAGAWDRVPIYHFIAFALAVVLFWAAVASYTRSRWLAFAAALPLCFGVTLAHLPLITTDSPAESLGLVCVSLLLLLATRPGRGWLWLLVGLTVFLACILRPNYQFIPVLFPALGALLVLCHAPEKASVARLLRTAVALAALTLLPLVAFSALRWKVVGHFGLVGLGGYHIGTIGALFLDDELVAELPEEHRPLARELLKGRRLRKFGPMHLRSWPPAVHGQFDRTMFRVAEPAAKRLVVADWQLTLHDDGTTNLGPLDVPGMMGASALEMDRRLGAFGKAAIARRPLLYLKWITDGLRLGWSWLFEGRPFRLLLTSLVLSLGPLLLALAFARGRVDRSAADAGDRLRGLRLLGLALAGFGYCAASLQATVMVHFPKDRYADAAALLVPSVLAALLFEVWRWTRELGASGDGGG